MLPTVGQPTPHVTEPLLVSWTWPRRRKQRGRYWFLLDFGVHAAALDALIVVQNIEIVEHRWRWVALPIALPIALPMVHPGLAERRQTTPAPSRRYPSKTAKGSPTTRISASPRDLTSPAP